MATNARPIGPTTLLVAAAIRAVRAARNLTQAELSRQTGISEETLRKMERGRTAIDVEQLGKIAEAFGQDLERFMRFAFDNANLYRPDGSLNPADTTGYRLSDEEMDELRAEDTENEG